MTLLTLFASAFILSLTVSQLSFNMPLVPPSNTVLTTILLFTLTVEAAK